MPAMVPFSTPVVPPRPAAALFAIIFAVALMHQSRGTPGSEQAAIGVDSGNLLLSIPIGGSLLVNGLDLLAALSASQTQNTLLAASVTSLNATVWQQAAQISTLAAQNAVFAQLIAALQANQTVCLLTTH